MLTFKPRSQIQSWAFEVELGRLSALVSDMEQVGLGTPVEDLVEHAPRPRQLACRSTLDPVPRRAFHGPSEAHGR